MRRPVCIGIDPGPTTGIAICWAGIQPEWSLIQCTHDVVFELLDGLLNPLVLAVETYVVGARSGKSSTPDAGRITRELVGNLTAWAVLNGLRGVQRPAALVKPWATDERLAAAGIVAAKSGMRHALDAARHGLYATKAELGMPDPLSRKART